MHLQCVFSHARQGAVCLNHIRNLFRALSPALFSCGGSEQGRPLDSNRFQCKGCGKPFPSGRADERRLIRPLKKARKIGTLASHFGERQSSVFRSFSGFAILTFAVGCDRNSHDSRSLIENGGRRCSVWAISSAVSAGWFGPFSRGVCSSLI